MLREKRLLFSVVNQATQGTKESVQDFVQELRETLRESLTSKDDG